MSELFLDVFNMSITASYLVLAVVVARLLLKKAPKWINCLLWALVGIRLICPFSFESSLSLIPSSQTITVNNSSTGRPFTVQSGVPVVDTNINEFLGDKYYEGVTVPTSTFADMTTILSIIWIVGLFAMLLYGSISYFRLHKQVGASLLFNDDIYYCDNIDTPFILGFFKPKIYVPSGITEEQISYISLHEKAHLKRKDHWWKPLGFILLSVYWFNPVMWVAYILLCRDIETACDEKVIKNMPNNEKKGYSETLVSCSVQRKMVMACPLAFGEVGVKQRIKSVLNYKKPAFWMIVFAVLFIIVVAIFFLTNPVNNKIDKNLNKDDTISYGDSYEVLHYNGVDYILFSEPKYFHPFLTDPYSISKDEYVIEDDCFADKKDKNLCFIYSRGGILRDLVYIKEGVSIPDRITTFSEVDAVVISTPDGYYYIDNRENINLLIDFFNSKEVIEMESLQPVEVDSSKAINIYAISNYYGGIFSLNRGYAIFSEKGKYVIGVKDKELIFPDNINITINQAIEN